MKYLSLLCVTLLAFATQASAGIFTITTNFSGTLANGGYIPDGDPNGWASTIDLGTGYTGQTVQGVSVSFTIQGGWNGDLYGYLVHDSGFVVLLDRVGQTGTPGQTFGYSNAGFDNVTLNGTAGTVINTVGSYSSTTAITGGPYRAQGTTFSSFNGTDVNGTWSLFFADRSSGDISQVTGWSLSIDAVPEPTTWAMLIFGTVFAGWRFVSWRTKQA